MGYYIEVHGPWAKASQLIVNYGAEHIEQPKAFTGTPGKVLICVVENPFFDAAAICYDKAEFEEFNDPSDPRPKTWLLMDRATVVEQCPSVANRL